jgi:hypothetical protein
MDEHTQKAFAYRQRAEELRVTIPDMKDAQARAVLLRIAADYETLAIIQDRLARHW